jgi:hypothetical protein
MRGSHYGLHVGTRQAALEALNARIGTPAEGEWDGTRIYGKTLLSPGMRTGYSSAEFPGAAATRDDTPKYPSGRATYSDNTAVPLDAIPDVYPVNITGRMTNTPSTPHGDWKANGLMAGQIKRGRAKSGYYYTNEGEDAGSISAVVPGPGHVERADAGIPKQMRLF